MTCHRPCGSEKCRDLCDNERIARKLAKRDGYRKLSADEFNERLSVNAFYLFAAAIGLVFIFGAFLK